MRDEDHEKLIEFYQHLVDELMKENIRLFDLYCKTKQELFELKGGVGGFLAADTKESNA